MLLATLSVFGFETCKCCTIYKNTIKFDDSVIIVVTQGFSHFCKDTVLDMHGFQQTAVILCYFRLANLWLKLYKYILNTKSASRAMKTNFFQSCNEQWVPT